MGLSIEIVRSFMGVIPREAALQSSTLAPFCPKRGRRGLGYEGFPSSARSAGEAGLGERPRSQINNPLSLLKRGDYFDVMKLEISAGSIRLVQDCGVSSRREVQFVSLARE